MDGLLANATVNISGNRWRARPQLTSKIDALHHVRLRQSYGKSTGCIIILTGLLGS